MIVGDYHFFYSKKLEENKKRMVSIGQAPKEVIFVNKIVDDDGLVMQYNFATKSIKGTSGIVSHFDDVEYLTTTDISASIKDGYPSLLAISRLNMSAISRPTTKKLIDDSIFFFFSEKMRKHLSDQNIYKVVDVDGAVMRYNFCSTSADDISTLFSKDFDDFVLLTKTSAFSLIINGVPTSTARERMESVKDHLGYFSPQKKPIKNMEQLKKMINNFTKNTQNKSFW